MIIVVGSRHDSAAKSLVDAWPSATLCSAEDLTQPGWAWGAGLHISPAWVAGGNVVGDERVTGVFVRRSTVYPEELVTTHPDDRSYLASEAHAFLVFVLGMTRATVVNPVADGALGEEVLRPERWMPAAAKAGLTVAPLRFTNSNMKRRPFKTFLVEVVGGETFGDAPSPVIRGALAVAQELRLLWATLVFDGRRRLITITCTNPPSTRAVAALGRLLSTPRPA